MMVACPVKSRRLVGTLRVWFVEHGKSRWPVAVALKRQTAKAQLVELQSQNPDDLYQLRAYDATPAERGALRERPR